MRFKNIPKNRKTAEYNMNSGVGKLNSLMMNYKAERGKKGANVVSLKNNLIKDIMDLAIGTPEQPKQINPDVFYAAIEALGALGKNGLQEVSYKQNLEDLSEPGEPAIFNMFYVLEKQRETLPEEQQAKIDEILKSDKMTIIRFNDAIARNSIKEAAKFIPQLQDVSKSHGIARFSQFLDEAVKNVAMFDMTEEELLQTRQELNVTIASTTQFLTEKFNKHYDFETGVELLKLKLATGTGMAEIKKLANMVYLSSKKFNIEEFSEQKLQDFSLVVQLTGDVNALESLKKLTSRMGSKSSEFFAEEIADRIRESKTYKELSEEERVKLDNNFESIKSASTQSELTPKQKQAEAIIANSYSYAGTLGNIEEATYVGGNFQFKGQVPDHCITKNDVMVFDTLLTTEIYKLFPLIDVSGSKTDPQNRNIPKDLEAFAFKKLSDLDFQKDMSIFMKVTDGMIRSRFTTMNFAGTELNMEKQALLKESAYNDAFKSIMAESGAFGLNVNGNSLTNISTLFSEGVGDCRHHAQVKQIMFDRWKDAKMNEAIQGLSQASTDAEQTALRDSIDTMSRTELRTFDVRISTNLQMEESVGFWSKKKNGEIVEAGVYVEDSMYRPVRGEDDKFEVTEGMSCLEEHTMCMLVTRDKDGGLEELRYADAFYQEPGKGGDYDLSYDREGAENLASNVEFGVDRSGKLVFKLNQKGLFNKDNVAEGKDVSVSFSPTNYAGKRDYELYGRLEHSQICGIQYDKEVTVEQLLADIADTTNNHAERKKAGESYSFIRMCIVKNIISKNIKEDANFDVEYDEREALEKDCKTKKVTEMEGESEKRLKNVCNGLSEMRSETYCTILYNAINKVAEIVKNNPEIEITNELLEQACDECSQEYFKANGLDDENKNRDKEVKKKAQVISHICGELDKSEPEEYKSDPDNVKSKEYNGKINETYRNIVKSLKLAFPRDIVEKFIEGVENGKGEINFNKFRENVRQLESAGIQLTSGLSESGNPEVTPEGVKEDPQTTSGLSESGESKVTPEDVKQDPQITSGLSESGEPKVTPEGVKQDPQITSGLSESGKPKVTPEDVKQDPQKIVEVTIEEFAADPVGYVTSAQEGVEAAEKSGMSGEMYGVVADNIEGKKDEIEKTISREHESKQVENVEPEKNSEESLESALKVN